MEKSKEDSPDALAPEDMPLAEQHFSLSEDVSSMLQDVLRRSRFLDAEEQFEMRQEISAAFGKARSTGQWDEYRDTLAAWKAAADALSYPQVRAALLAAPDPAHEVLLRRP